MATPNLQQPDRNAIGEPLTRPFPNALNLSRLSHPPPPPPHNPLPRRIAVVCGKGLDITTLAMQAPR